MLDSENEINLQLTLYINYTYTLNIIHYNDNSFFIVYCIIYNPVYYSFYFQFFHSFR